MIDPEKKKGFHIPLYVWLSYLLVATMLCTGVTFAKYTAVASGSASAQVAKFSITTNATSGQDITLEDGAESGTYTFTVTSGSEVSVEYDVVVTLPSDLPSGVTMKLDGKDATVDGFVYTFEKAGSFTPNPTKAIEHTLTITAGSFDAAQTLSGIQVDVVATQVD